MSKKIVSCGICGYEGCRDLKKHHFPAVYQGLLYIEKGEKPRNFTKKKKMTLNLHLKVKHQLISEVQFLENMVKIWKKVVQFYQWVSKLNEL